MSAAPSVEALSTTITSRRSRCNFDVSDRKQALRWLRQFQLTTHTEATGRAARFRGRLRPSWCDGDSEGRGRMAASYQPEARAREWGESRRVGIHTDAAALLAVEPRGEGPSAAEKQAG